MAKGQGQSFGNTLGHIGEDRPGVSDLLKVTQCQCSRLRTGVLIYHVGAASCLPGLVGTMPTELTAVSLTVSARHTHAALGGLVLSARPMGPVPQGPALCLFIYPTDIY